MDPQSTPIKNALTVAVSLVVAYTFYHSASPKLPTSQYLRGQEYLDLRVRGRIDTIYQYDKGYPVVRIAGQNMRMSLSSGAQRYLAVGDSVVKEPHNQDITTYRQYPQFVEVMHWSSPSRNPEALEDGFVGRETLPVH